MTFGRMAPGCAISETALVTRSAITFADSAARPGTTADFGPSNVTSTSPSAVPTTTRVFDPPPSTPTTISLTYRLTSRGAACVNDDRIPMPTVKEVPIKTYHGNAMCESAVNVLVIPGKTGIICLAKTTKLIATMPTAIPVI